MKAQMRLLSIGLLFLPALITQAQVRAVVPAQASAHANRSYSPGVDAEDYVYISGQGPRRPDGTLPATFVAQVRQALDNIKAIVEAAGLTMDHLVYTQVYLEDLSKYGEMNGVFAEYFGKTPPARAVLGVAKVPEPPIQINAVAVRSLSDKRAVYPPNNQSDESAAPGMLTHDRLFISGMLRRSRSSSGIRPRPDAGSPEGRRPRLQQHGHGQSLSNSADPDASHERALCAEI